MNQDLITQILGNLINWLETWRDENGAYNGFVVHRTETKRMKLIHDTAWTQSAIIRGYGNLFRKSQETRWGESMLLAADLLASRYDPDTGIINHTGHEDERFHSLVHCALAVNALLSIVDLIDNSRKQKYIQLSCDHVKRYWFEKLWVDEEGAFKFNEIDFYSPNCNRFVVNFNATAAEALIRLTKVTDDKLYLTYALKIGEWLLKHWNLNKFFNAKILKNQITITDDPNSDWMPPGGLSYQFSSSQKQPDNYVTLYTGLSLRGYVALYKETKNEAFMEIVQNQCNYLLSMRDPDSKLFYHSTRNGKIDKYPIFVAGAGMILSGLYEAEKVTGWNISVEDTLQSIMNKAYLNGSFPNFIGKDRTFLRKGKGIVWEDVAASPNWNAQLFEYLTDIIKNPNKIIVPRCNSKVCVVNKRFIYLDMLKSVLIISWLPIRSAGIYLILKTVKKSIIAVSLIGIFNNVKLLNSYLQKVLNLKENG